MLAWLAPQVRAQQAPEAMSPDAPAGSAEPQAAEPMATPQAPDASPDESPAVAAEPDTPSQSEAGVPAGDPPSRVLRLAVAHGDLSVEPAGVDSFSAAQRNDVLTTGDRLYADPAAEAELQGGQLAVRLGGGADLTVTAMTDTLAQFGLAAGAAHLRAYAIDPGTVLELDTLEAAVTLLQPGDVRVDEDAANHVTTVELMSGSAQVDGPGISQVLTPGQRLRVHAADPDAGREAYAETVAPGAPDALDSWEEAQDNAYASDADVSSAYVNADTVGFSDLANNGTWDSCDFGPVWFPAVAVDWVPYRHGHWVWRAPWGWTWIGSEPWGFAPYHYGRWVEWRGRWGWIPGPPLLRPTYAPALVAFAGGREFAGSIGFAPGFGITAWFPLGPHEVYNPPYRGSTLYLNRVNASNLFDPNAAQARALYNQRAVAVFTGVTQARHSYANRALATTAVPESSFVAGRAVNNAALRIAPATLASAPVQGRAPAAPESAALLNRPARALPPDQTRRATLASNNDRGIGTAPSGGILFVQRAQPPVGAVGGVLVTRPTTPLGMRLPEVPAGVRPYHPAPPVGREPVPHAPPPHPSSAPAATHTVSPAARH